jgi:hypothetical protein
MLSEETFAVHSEALMIEAVRTSETSVYFNEATRRNSLEGYYLHVWDVFVKYCFTCSIPYQD